MNRKRILILLGTALAFCIIVYVAFYFIFLDLLVELWWFRALDFSAYFWLRLLYRFIIPGGVALLFFFIFFTNFWFGSRFLGVEEDNPAEKASRKRKNLLEKFRTGAMDVYTVVSLILALMIATPFYLHWEEALLFFFAPASAASDPFYNNNISFYLFSLPVYELIQQVLLATFTLLFLSMSLLYTLEHRIQVKIGNELPKGARVHLTFLIMLVFLIVAWGFMLQRYGLLYIDSHEPVFYGPGFVDMIYDLPLIWSAMFTFLATAISLVVLIHSHGKRGYKTLVLFGIIFITVVVLRQYDFIPRLLTKFYVQPNPVKAEKRYMSNNIKATLAAYKLNDVTTTDVKVTLKPEDDLAMWVTKEHLQSIPVWDRELLDDVYYQLQGLRPYYAFPSVDEDRYFLDGYLQQVNLAARELNLANLPKEAHSWENEHMRYTHGFGAVMTPAA